MFGNRRLVAIDAGRPVHRAPFADGLSSAIFLRCLVLPCGCSVGTRRGPACIDGREGQYTMGELFVSLLPVFSALVILAAAISVAGHLTGSVGADAVVFLGWSILTLWQPLLWRMTAFEWRTLMLSAIVVAISVCIVYGPMRYLKGLHWLRMRLSIGVLFAIVATIIYPMQLFILGCALGVDCI